MNQGFLKLFLKKSNRGKRKVFLYLIYLIKIIFNTKKLKKIGNIGLPHSQNIGNNLLKYAIYIKVCELGFDPYIVGQRYGKENISFILGKAQVRLTFLS